MFEFLKDKVYTIGGDKIRLSSILTSIAIIIASYLIAYIFSHLIKREFRKTKTLNKSFIKTVTRFIKYFILIIGFFIAFQVLGVNLSSLAFLAGVIGLGIGFGMQNIISNFISGIIILFEKPIKEGEYVEVAGYDGIVTDIRARSTTITTRDNISIIVPNSNFITSNVINWSHKDPKIRLHIPLGIEETASKLDIAKKVLLEIAEENPEVLKKPVPSIWFTKFGSSSFDLELIVWIQSPIRRHFITSDINFAIAKKFAEYDIDLTYPWTNLAFRNELKIKTDKAFSNNDDKRNKENEMRDDNL
ncbi:MAG: mechanosensitive ion channel [Deltaproteobacteria bacterium]|nr:mechanosensitive ion channel [Deltaproteobacteria bacterium]